MTSLPADPSRLGPIDSMKPPHRLPPSRPVAEPDIVRFGLFELDLRRAELRRKGVGIPLQHQPFEILRLLVAQHGDFVSRELIQQTLWPDGGGVDFERSINTAIMKLRQALRESASAPTYIETVPRSGYRLIAPLAGADETTPAIAAIAILPLRDLSSSPDTQYFVDGLTDGLITEMVRRSGLRVVSRISMSRYKHSHQSARAIAAELNVQAIIEGSILRSASRIRISARLLDAVGDRHVWAQTYDRNLEDILLLYQEIATDIVSCVSRALQAEPTRKAARPVNPEAYDQYLRGNFLLSLRASGAWSKSIDCYQAAVELEPEWASPCAALAEVYRLLHITKLTDSQAIARQIVPLGERALLLDPDCALAHATLGAHAALHQWRWTAGRRQIETALRLDSQSSHVQYVLATVLLNRGWYPEALQHIDAALAGDYSSLFFRSYRIQVLFYARQYEEALRESEHLHEDNSRFAVGLMQHGACLSALQRHAEALPLLERSFASLPYPMTKAGIAHSQWGLGLHEAARRTVEEMSRMHREGNCAHTVLSLALAVIGEHESAIQRLQTAFDEHDTTLPLTIQLPPIDPIRCDARVARLLQRVYAD